MRSAMVATTVCLAVLALIPLGVASQVAQGDLRAIALVSQTVAAMGGTVPSSTSATGTVALVEGSLEEFGRIRILTRGMDESREEIQTLSVNRGRIYANGLAAKVEGTAKEIASLELAASSQTPNFPLAVLAGALQEPDFSFEYLGLEDLNGVLAHHVRFWNTYASQPKLQSLTEFTVKAVWIDASTGLPRKIAYDQREAGGAAPSVAVAATYSDYRNVGGVLYPFLIERDYNGTPWATIRIDSVTLNAGVSDAEFTVK